MILIFRNIMVERKHRTSMEQAVFETFKEAARLTKRSLSMLYWTSFSGFFYWIFKMLCLNFKLSPTKTLFECQSHSCYQLQRKIKQSIGCFFVFFVFWTQRVDKIMSDTCWFPALWLSNVRCLFMPLCLYEQWNQYIR